MSYPVLINTLDVLIKEAPKTFKTYHPRKTDIDKLNQARAKAFIHLFLKVRFGVLAFSDRHSWICDGAQDGGIDAYYIDQENKSIYFIQSKFRTTEENFEEKSISVSELLRMEVGRISRGETTDSNGQPFSSKVVALQNSIKGIRDVALYKWRVILLANLHRVNDEQLRRLIDNMEYEVFDHEKTYKELVFPLTTGTYYQANEIIITINLGAKTHPQLSQDVSTPLGNCKVRMIFVPIVEIAKVAAKYKNSLLRYNPRNYLSLQRNEVNQSIKDTVLNTAQNEFALRNNGITVLAEYSSVTDRTGVSGEGQLIIKDPQILNGGQTATTLAMIHEDPSVGTAVFGEKEVLLKIIEKPANAPVNDLLNFIESISDATNQQSRIVEADRRANDPNLLSLQKYFYAEHGLFLERKRGEFQYGLDSKVIKKASVINRVDLLRALTAFNGEPAKSRSSEDKMFEEERFEVLLANFNAPKIVRAYFSLQAIEAANLNRDQQGLATITSGKYALLMATAQVGNDQRSMVRPVEEQAKNNVEAALAKWDAFQAHIKGLSSNLKYNRSDGFNYDGYYKGSTVAADIQAYNWN